MHNPDASEIFRWRYERSVRDFTAGGSTDVLRASLYAINYRGRRLEDEVNYQIGIRHDIQQHHEKAIGDPVLPANHVGT